MRFALIATTAAAVVAVPFALAAAGPRMSSSQFIEAVRCTAYEDVSGAQVSEAKYELNAEGARQPAETFAAARAAASEVARQAVNSQTAADQAMLRSQRAAACSQAELANGAGDDNEA